MAEATDLSRSAVARIWKAFRAAAASRRDLQTVDAAVPSGLDVHLILDNDATDKTAAIRRWLVKRPRYHIRFTPTSASWLNLVERWLWS